MISINYDDKLFTYTEKGNPSFDIFSFAWSKEAFEAMAGVDASPFDKVVYEPDLNMYCVTMANAPGQVLSFPDPTEHPALAWIHNNVDNIKDQAEQGFAVEQGYAWDANQDIYVPAIDLMSMEEYRLAVIQDIRVVAFSHAQTILGLAKIADLTALDISAQVTSRLQDIRDWMNDMEAEVNAISDEAILRAYQITELVHTPEADINYVMGLL